MNILSENILQPKRVLESYIKENGEQLFKVEWEPSWVSKTYIESFKKIFEDFAKPFIKSEVNENLEGIDQEDISSERLPEYTQESTGSENTTPPVPIYPYSNSQLLPSSSSNNAMKMPLTNDTNIVDVILPSKVIDARLMLPRRQKREPFQMFKCATCGAEFVHRTHLKIHERIHTGEKPYKCSFCERAFAQKGNLHVHMKIHTGVRDYACKFCRKTFVTNAQLSVHERTHLKIKFDEPLSASVGQLDQANFEDSAGRPLPPDANNFPFGGANTTSGNFSPLQNRETLSHQGEEIVQVFMVEN